MTNLTRRQQEIHAYLREYQSRFDYPPTLDELCQALGLRSRGSLHKHIQALVDAGLVRPMEGRQRGIRLVETADQGLPFLGYIAAGQPIEAIETAETMDIPPHLCSNRSCYVLGVKGDSMIEAGIFDGDWVVVEERNHAHNGEIVVALIDGFEATLKRLEQTAEAVILHPANSALEPLLYEHTRVTIQGVVVAQMRRY